MIKKTGIGRAKSLCMPASATLAPASSAPVVGSAAARDSWAEIEHWTLEACVLRAEGREPEAVRVLQERIPDLIRAWSACCGLPRAEVQERLRRMFADTQDLVARGIAQRRIITAELLAARERPDRSAGVGAGVGSGSMFPPAAGGASGPVGLRRAVPFGDISGMLDGLAEAEREARREAIWPLRSAATLAAARI